MSSGNAESMADSDSEREEVYAACPAEGYQAMRIDFGSDLKENADPAEDTSLPDVSEKL